MSGNTSRLSKELAREWDVPPLNWFFPVYRNSASAISEQLSTCAVLDPAWNQVAIEQTSTASAGANARHAFSTSLLNLPSGALLRRPERSTYGRRDAHPPSMSKIIWSIRSTAGSVCSRGQGCTGRGKWTSRVFAPRNPPCRRQSDNAIRCKKLPTRTDHAVGGDWTSQRAMRRRSPFC